MNYPVNPAQKALLERANENVNFQGDDNDFSCLLSRIALKCFMAGDRARAWECYQNDPMATYGVTEAAWMSHMKDQVIRHQQNEDSKAAHDRAMGQAG